MARHRGSIVCIHCHRELDTWTVVEGWKAKDGTLECPDSPNGKHHP